MGDTFFCNHAVKATHRPPAGITHCSTNNCPNYYFFTCTVNIKLLISEYNVFDQLCVSFDPTCILGVREILVISVCFNLPTALSRGQGIITGLPQHVFSQSVLISGGCHQVLIIYIFFNSDPKGEERISEHKLLFWSK